jgi:hypothetical protein
MDKGHSQLIVLLLAGIFAVLLFGREAVFGSMETMFWIGIVVGIPVLLIWAIVAFTRYLKREARAYRDEVRGYKRQGLPRFYLFAAWPGIIGNFLVVGWATYRYFIDNACRYFAGCLQEIPLYWIFGALLVLSLPISLIEQAIIRRRKRNAVD